MYKAPPTHTHKEGRKKERRIQDVLWVVLIAMISYFPACFVGGIFNCILCITDDTPISGLQTF